MAIYSGLSPEDALARWYQLQHTPQEQLGSLSPEERAEATSGGGMVTLAKENPGAWQLRKTGTAPTQRGGKNTRTVFNEQTGQWDTQDVHGLWSHPETWFQVAAGGALGGLAAAPLLAGSAALPSTTTAATSGILPTGSAGIVGGASAAAAPTAAAATAPILASTSLATGGAGIGGGLGAGAGITGGTGAGGGSVSGLGTILKGIKTGVGYANDAKSAVDTVRDIAGNTSAVAGAAEANRNTAQDANTRAEYQREAMRQGAPATILKNVTSANALANGPVRPEWGGVGAGGFPALTYRGGKNEGLNPATRAQMQPFIDQQIQDLLNPRMDQPQFDPSRSTGVDKALGGIALGGGLLGGVLQGVKGATNRGTPAAAPADNSQGTNPTLPYGSGLAPDTSGTSRTDPLPGAGSPSDYGEVVDQYQGGQPPLQNAGQGDDDSLYRRYGIDPDDPSRGITS